jgi:hypothetical protein
VDLKSQAMKDHAAVCSSDPKSPTCGPTPSTTTVIGGVSVGISTSAGVGGTGWKLTCQVKKL